MKAYKEAQNNRAIANLNAVLEQLPQWVRYFFTGKENSTSARTRLSYAYDIRIFLEYLSEKIFHIPIKEIKLEHLNQVTTQDVEIYASQLAYYTRNEKIYTNDKCGKFRKLASLRSFYNYFYKREMIQKNPTLVLEMPEIEDKAITQLDQNEIVKLLNGVDKGNNLNAREQKFHRLTRKRDIALLSLLLGTGMRVSECAGIDMDDLDLNERGVRVLRKGGKEHILYFNNEVAKALESYILEKEEKGIQSVDNALFVSLKGKRMAVRTIQAMVKKYSERNITLKTITAHKLRSTYGTQLYRKTGDIYLVADALGHRDVNTTKKHYAKMDDNRRKQAADIIQLREME